MLNTKTGELKIGQEVAIVDGYGNGYGRGQTYYFGYVVHKITPTGQITVIHSSGSKKRFDKNGWEIGGASTRWHRDYLETDVKVARNRNEECKRNRSAARTLNSITALGGITIGTERGAIMERIEFIRKSLDEAERIMGGSDASS